MSSPAAERLRGDRRGVALVVVLVAMVLVGILISGAFFGSTQELRAGRGAIEQERALAAAEFGLYATLARLQSDSLTAVLGAGSPVEHEGITTTGSITRLSALHYWITVRAVANRAGGGGATRRLGAIAVLDVPDLTPAAAIAFSGAGPVPEPLHGIALRIDGGDVANPADGCSGAAEPIAGVALSDHASFGVSTECTTGSCVTGSPPVLATPGLRDASTLGGVGAATWNELTSRATITLPAGVLVGGWERPLGPRVHDGACDRSVDHNWGDVDRATPCADYFPIVHAAGDLHVAGGAGQGILVVEGDLVLSGGARFAGAVLVRGSLQTTDGGGHVAGAVWVAGQAGSGSSLAGGGRFEYSHCALLAALSRHGAPTLLLRSWTELH